MITLEQAKALRPGVDYVNQPTQHNADGTPRRWKVTSVKTWKSKRNAHRVCVGLKYGLYTHDYLTEDDLHLVNLGYGS